MSESVDLPVYAVALFPALAAANEVREVKVMCLSFFGGSPEECIGAEVIEKDSLARTRHIVPVQRLVFVASKTGTFSANDLARKRADYLQSLQQGRTLNLFSAPPPRRKPRLMQGKCAAAGDDMESAA